MVPLDPQLDKYKQCLLAKGSLVWAALPHSVIVDKISPNRKKCFVLPPSRCQRETETCLCSTKSITFAFVFVHLCANFILSCNVKSLSKYPSCSHDLCRYGTGQRPLLPFDPHLNVDINSSGESSSGFTSQESTMERCKTGISTCCISSTVVFFFFFTIVGSYESYALVNSKSSILFYYILLQMR